ncbi:MAG: MerR family DNA-binding transcriptional regulator [Patescibacteria group bacterium]|nr:MerR family DNA-binding transcriptional regulator [Patescibacteria group bacterium]
MHRFTHTSMDKQLLAISEAAKLLGVSIDTLRRWDNTGRLSSIRSGPRGHRFYKRIDLEYFLKGIDTIARNWAESHNAEEPNPEVYCPTRDIFQARLEKLQKKLSKIFSIEKVSLITAIAGEIGSNSFDHNLGNWPDISGIFFSYTIRNRMIVLADRGQGILTTLKRVRPELSSSSEAIKVAFTETISGRYPETRGNGLKFVKSIIEKNPFSLYFQTGDAQLYLRDNESELNIQIAKTIISGCFAIISFEEQL